MAKKTPPPPRPSRPLVTVDGLARRINFWPRPLRIVTATFCSLVLAAMLGYLLSLFFDLSPDSTQLNLYFGLVTAIGIGAYFFGWLWLVGFDQDENQPWVATRASAYYVLAGTGVFLLALLLILLTLLLGELELL